VAKSKRERKRRGRWRKRRGERAEKIKERKGTKKGTNRNNKSRVASVRENVCRGVSPRHALD
jgi:hypothetical protein